MFNSKEDKVIQKALDNIKIRDMKSLEEINKENIQIIDNLCERFHKYPNSKIFREKAKIILETNELAIIDDIDDINIRDYLWYIDVTKFYNLKFKKVGFYVRLINKPNNINIIQTLINPKPKKYHYFNMENKVIFRSLKDKDKLKMKLVEIIKN